MSTNDLDRAWASINALGGSAVDPFDRGYVCAIGHALQIIERLGGTDPAARAAAERRERNVFAPEAGRTYRETITSPLATSGDDCLPSDTEAV